MPRTAQERYHGVRFYKFSSPFRSYVGPAVLTVILLMMSVESGLALESVTVKCGTNVDISNVDAGNISTTTPISSMKFNNLDTGCYGKKIPSVIGFCCVLTNALGF